MILYCYDDRYNKKNWEK